MTQPIEKKEQGPRVQLSRDALLQTFVELHKDTAKPLDMIPKQMEETMSNKWPFMHLLSTYVIRPSAFDRDPILSIKKHLPEGYSETQVAFKPNYMVNKDTTQMMSARGTKDIIERPKTAAVAGASAFPSQEAPASKGKQAADDFDDFEEVQVKVKKTKPLRQPFATNDATLVTQESEQVVEKVVAVQEEAKVVAVAEVKAPTVAKVESVKPVAVAVASVTTKPVAVKQEQQVKECQDKNVGAQVKKAVVKEEKKRPQTAAVATEKKRKQSMEVKEEETQAAAALIEEEKETPEVQYSEEMQEKMKLLAGPRPKGLKKFKTVKVEEEATPVEELSESQLNKLSKKKIKLEADLKAKKDAELLIKKKDEEARAQRQRIYEEKQSRMAQDMFANLAAIQEAKQKEVKPQSVTNFEEVKFEQDKMAKKEATQKRRADDKRQAEAGPSMKFDYNSFGRQQKIQNQQQAKVEEQKQGQSLAAVEFDKLVQKKKRN